MRHAKQIMTPFTLRRLKSQVLSQLPAKVSSTEYCQLTETQWTLYRGVVERSLRVNQGRHGECLQGNVVCWEIVASLCCGLVVREAVSVVSCAEIASVHSPSNIVLSSIFTECTACSVEVIDPATVDDYRRAGHFRGQKCWVE